MPRRSTCPDLYDEALQLNLTKLKEWNYLKPGIVMTTTVTWSSNGKPRASISLLIDTNSEFPYVELSYNYKNEPRKYKVYLVSVPSNLGRGKIIYFLCPHTNKRCRKLYSFGGYFLHRTAFKGCMYEKQTHSHDTRKRFKIFDGWNYASAANEMTKSKHFKRFYNGKPTKRYMKLFDKIKKAPVLTEEEICRLYSK